MTCMHELVLLIAVPRDIMCWTSDRDANLCLVHPQFCHGKSRVYRTILLQGAGDDRRQLLLGALLALLNLRRTFGIKLEKN